MQRSGRPRPRRTSWRAVLASVHPVRGDRFCPPAAWRRAIALATFRILAGATSTPPADRAQTKGAVLPEGATLPRLSETDTVNFRSARQMTPGLRW